MADAHAAAREGNLEALRAFISSGGNLNRRDKHQRTPLHLAAWAGKVRSTSCTQQDMLIVISEACQMNRPSLASHYSSQHCSGCAVKCMLTKKTMTVLSVWLHHG
jgi:ankyrin repeat protein